MRDLPVKKQYGRLPCEWIVNDNDGVDDSNGETRLINLGPIL